MRESNLIGLNFDLALVTTDTMKEIGSLYRQIRFHYGLLLAGLTCPRNMYQWKC